MTDVRTHYAGDGCSEHAVVPVEQVRALVRLLTPDHLTPAGARQIEAVCAQAESVAS